MMADLGTSVLTIDDWQDHVPLPEDVERWVASSAKLSFPPARLSKPSVELLSLLQLPSNSVLIHQCDGYSSKVFYGHAETSLLKWKADEFDDMLKEMALEFM
jgi:hypothetical protein